MKKILLGLIGAGIQRSMSPFLQEEEGRHHGLRVHYQLNTFLHCFRLHELGYPTFNILPHAPDIFLEDERRSAEPFFSVLALLGGTHVIRSHEVRTVHRIRQVMDLYQS